mmetsp:Transcript_26185/g.57725  ORF Transcript_26185/g.57725 Transcript_26185/m.57725 type:complete len:187 (+) Transcript_26185:51-611(+)
MPRLGLGGRACGSIPFISGHSWIGHHPVSFAVLHSKAWNEDSGQSWVKEEEILNLGPDADILPLCEDLNPETVGNGDSCWSTCEGQCPNDVLQKGLVFDFDEISPGHPGCTSHFECVGNKDRVLCHGVPEVEADAAPAMLVTGPFDKLQSVAGRASAGTSPSLNTCELRSMERSYRLRKKAVLDFL